MSGHRASRAGERRAATFAPIVAPSRRALPSRRHPEGITVKRILVTLLLGLAVAGPLQASRADRAEQHIQQARAALSAGDHQDALARLREAERVLGFANPVILHLRIQAQQVPLEAGQYRYLDLREQRGNCAIYMHEFGVNHPADAISPEIARICATLKAYPGDALEVVRANLEARRHAAALEDLTALERFGGAWSEARALLRIRALEQALAADDSPERRQALRREARDYLDRVAAGQGEPTPVDLGYVRALARGN